MNEDEADSYSEIYRVPEQVTDYVNRLIDSVGPEGLFVCPGCDCPVNAKYENIVAMVKATNEWK